MILESIQGGRLPQKVTQGMIALLYKGGPIQALTNWRPITLLKIGYKIYAQSLANDVTTYNYGRHQP
jgi:hypothetical protein